MVSPPQVPHFFQPANQWKDPPFLIGKSTIPSIPCLPNSFLYVFFTSGKLTRLDEVKMSQTDSLVLVAARRQNRSTADPQCPISWANNMVDSCDFFFFARYPRECEELRGPVTKITGKNTGNAWAFAFLVGGIPTPLKNMKVNWDEDIPNIWKNKKCCKPPTSY